MRPVRLVVPLVAMWLCVTSTVASRKDTWETLARRLVGGFSSEAQSREDPDYFDVRCHVLPLWRIDSGVRWLYVERAVPGRPDAPFRQTVYRLGDDPAERKGGKRFELLAFAINDAARFAGAAVDNDKLDAMTPADLVPRPGCAVI